MCWHRGRQPLRQDLPLRVRRKDSLIPGKLMAAVVCLLPLALLIIGMISSARRIWMLVDLWGSHQSGKSGLRRTL
jgi:hypothetical protein